MKKKFQLIFAIFALSILAGCGTTVYGYGYNGDLEYNHYYEDLHGYPTHSVIIRGHYRNGMCCTRYHGHTSYPNRHPYQRRYRSYSRCYWTQIEVWDHRLRAHILKRKRICR